MSEDRVANLLSGKHIAWKDCVWVAEVGSTIHGINVEGQDDLDLTVVRMEPWSEFVSGPGRQQSMMIRTQPDGARSRVGDIDLQVYTLRKFGQLAAAGNPSILVAMFSPKRFREQSWMLKLPGIVATAKAGGAFLGYMRQQMERWKGERGQKNVARPELVEAYGFDTKYAGHIIRLGYQGVEYMTSGRITLPMPTDIAERIRSLRSGGLSEEEALDWATEVEAELIRAIEGSPLPESPGLAGLNRWLSERYADWYDVTRREDA